MKRTPPSPLPARIIMTFFLLCMQHAFPLFATAAQTNSATETHTQVVTPEQADSTALADALRALQQHIRGDDVLDNEAVDDLTVTITTHKGMLSTQPAAIRTAQDIVAAFDHIHGPLWLNHPPLHQREKTPEDATKWAVFWVMQHLFDELYNNSGILHHQTLLEGFRFGSADHFPGRVNAAPEPETVHTVLINASYPETWGAPVMHMERPARKPTGTYLAPGTFATVIVPESLVNKGYQIRVGAHSWDHQNKPRVLRLYRVSAVYEITQTEMIVGNPLGGGIYIEVPYKSDAGIIEVSVRNAVRSPYFSWKPFHRTTREEWQNTERHHPAPWADFQSERYMMQVPTTWVSALEEPDTLMENWDKALDVCSDLMGRPRAFGREILYNQVDLQLRGRAFHPGYPSGNRGFDPTEETDGLRRHHLVRGPQYAHNYEFHELGHAFLFPKYAGDREAAVNLPHVAVMHQAFGMNLDQALSSSRHADNDPFKTLDNTAIEWMMSDNFIGDGHMLPFERAYQLKGHAKYVDVARLFGWEIISNLFRRAHADYMDGKPWPQNSADEDGDIYTLRFSEAAGVDLRPLIHFWGVPIVNPEKSDDAFKAANLKPSVQIYDTLLHYQSLIPQDLAAFRAYAQNWWGKQPSTEGFTTERNHAARWESYDETQAQLVRDTIRKVLDQYFPAGRPQNESH